MAALSHRRGSLLQSVSLRQAVVLWRQVGVAVPTPQEPPVGLWPEVSHPSLGETEIGLVQ